MKKLAVGIALVLASVALVACGGGSSNSEETTESAPSGQSNPPAESGKEEGGSAEGGSAGSATAVDFEADPSGQLKFTTESATAEAGKDTIDFTNSSPLGHDVAIEDSSGKTIAKTEVISEGSDSTTANLKPGTYTFYCSVPGHREAGMEGTLTVK
jgi:plastocyanin